jgi:hypothetical protein
MDPLIEAGVVLVTGAGSGMSSNLLHQHGQ